MTEAQKQKIEAAIEAALRGVENTEDGVEVTDEHGGVVKLYNDGTCSCGEEKCLHRMAFEFGRIKHRICNNDTQGLLHREPAEMLLAATVVSHLRREEEKALSAAMDLRAGEVEMPYVSVKEAIQHHQHAARVRQAQKEREMAMRVVDHEAQFYGEAFARLLKELGVVGSEEVFAYTYRGTEYRVTVKNTNHDSYATVMLAEEALALAEA